MKLINLEAERLKRDAPTDSEETVQTDLTMAQFDEDARPEQLVLPTVDGEVAFLTDPSNLKGVLLSVDQARAVALELIRSAALVEFGALEAMNDE